MKINVKRFIQEPSYCAIAAVASLANYYNKNIDYNKTKKIVHKLFKRKKENEFEGLETPCIGLLLNAVGFNKVIIVSSDLDYFDYEWSTKSKKFLVELFLKNLKKKKCEYKKYYRAMHKFLTNSRKNNLIIDYNFGKYIRESIDKKMPLIATFNWSMLFRYKKDKNGDWEEHAVVVSGYNKNEVAVVDSNVVYYKNRLKKYRECPYPVSWENFMSVLGTGDLILASDYVGIK